MLCVVLSVWCCVWVLCVVCGVVCCVWSRVCGRVCVVVCVLCVLRVSAHRCIQNDPLRRGSSLCYWGELETRVTAAAQGGGGKLGTHELEQHMLHRGEDAGYKSRALLCPGSVLHTDSASSYAQLHRLKKDPRYERLGLLVTQVRHSRKRGVDG